ncbi:MAG: hypothetical protein R6U13_07040 [Desulfatiglandaceae bacterium]
MISLLGKYFRKWLLRLALAARDGAEAAASRFAPVDETKAKEKEKKIRPGTFETARFHGPPDHWIQLVKRHAPELLQPAPPHDVPFAASRVFDEHAAMDESDEVDPQGLKYGNEALENVCGPADQSLSLELPKKSVEFDARTASFDKDPDSVFIQFSEAAPKTPINSRRGSAFFTPSANQTGNINRRPSKASPMEQEKKKRLKSPNPERSDESVFSCAPAAQQRKEEATVERISFAAFPLPVAGHAKNIRPGETDEKIIQPDSNTKFRPGRRNDRYAVQSDLQAEKSRKFSQFDSKMTAFREVESHIVYEKNPGPEEFLMPSAISPAVPGQPPVPQIKKSRNGFKRSEKGPMNAGQRLVHPFEKKEAIEMKPSGPPVLHWPDLPGENSSGNVSGSLFSAEWPSLPEEKSIDTRSVLQQMETRFTETEPGESERLRRLDEEQKGMKWIALHF